MKSVKRTTPAERQQRPSYIENELRALTRCLRDPVQHPNVIKLLDAVQTDNHVIFILECVPGTDLFTAIKSAR
eukprot:g48976.t1